MVAQDKLSSLVHTLECTEAHQNKQVKTSWLVALKKSILEVAKLFCLKMPLVSFSHISGDFWCIFGKKSGKTASFYSIWSEESL